MVNTIEWVGLKDGAPWPGRVRMVDQTQLPERLVYLETDDVREIWDAIKQLKVRGAAAMGVAAAVQHVEATDGGALVKEAEKAAAYLATSRPTAKNLFWALDRMMEAARAAKGLMPEEFKTRLVEEAVAICEEDAAQCRAIGEHGLALLKDGLGVLTHCNAGSLATARYGTALSPLYMAHEKGMNIHVYVDETRPLLQGSRLTAWELSRAGIEVTLICDNMSAQVMKEGRIDAVLVGADRIAANGDTANKIGTYGLAVLARAHGIPFYVLAPTTTFDLALKDGRAIPIEERDPAEVTQGFGKQTAPADVHVYTPAFDVTPEEYITAIVCERGIVEPPYLESLKRVSVA